MSRFLIRLHSMKKYNVTGRPLLDGPKKLTALRVPEPLLKEMKRQAKKRGQSFSAFALHIFDDFVQWEVSQKKKVKHGL